MDHQATIYRVEVPGGTTLDFSAPEAPLRREVGDVVRGFATPRLSAVRAIVSHLNAVAFRVDGSHTAGARVLELADVQAASVDAMKAAKCRHDAQTDDGEVLCDSARVVAVHRGECFDEGGASGCRCGRYIVGEVEVMRREIGGHVYRLVLRRGDGNGWRPQPLDETAVVVDVDHGWVTRKEGGRAPRVVSGYLRSVYPSGWRAAVEVYETACQLAEGKEVS